MLPHSGILAEIYNWNKYSFAGNTEACDPIIKEHSFMSCYTARAKATQSMVSRPASLLYPWYLLEMPKFRPYPRPTESEPIN